MILPRTPSLRDVIGAHVAAALDQLRVSMPGRVESFDAATRTVEVTPLLKVPVHGDDGAISWEQLGRVPGVPLAMLSAGGHGIDIEIAAGDVVLLVFADFSLDRWKSGAGKTDPLGVVEPGLVATHALADAIAIPCLWDPRAAGPSPSVKVRRDGSVELGPGAMASGVGIGAAIRTELDALWNAIYGGHFHILPITGPVGSTPTNPAVGVPAKQTVESATVKTSS